MTPERECGHEHGVQESQAHAYPEPLHARFYGLAERILTGLAILHRFLQALAGFGLVSAGQGLVRMEPPRSPLREREDSGRLRLAAARPDADQGSRPSGPDGRTVYRRARRRRELASTQSEPTAEPPLGNCHAEGRGFESHQPLPIAEPNPALARSSPGATVAQTSYLRSQEHKIRLATRSRPRTSLVSRLRKRR